MECDVDEEGRCGELAGVEVCYFFGEGRFLGRGEGNAVVDVVERHGGLEW